MGIENNIIDHLDDHEKHLFNVIRREYNVDDYLKYSPEFEKDRTKVAYYADPIGEKFPLDTIDAIKLSYLYFQKSASYYDRNEQALIRSKIEKQANLNDISLEAFKPSTILEYEIPIDKFAVSIHKDKLDINTRHKCASYQYGDHYCWYPLDNHENVKTANLLFPRGLEGFDKLKPVVAEKIIASIGYENASPQVKNWGPVSKTAMLEELQLRKDLVEDYSPVLAKKYEILKQHFEPLPDSLPNRQKVASALESFDDEGRVRDSHPNLTHPNRLLAGWFEDQQDDQVYVKISGRQLPMTIIERSKEKVANYFPESQRFMKSASDFQRWVDVKSVEDRSVLIDLIFSKG